MMTVAGSTGMMVMVRGVIFVGREGSGEEEGGSGGKEEEGEAGETHFGFNEGGRGK